MRPHSPSMASLCIKLIRDSYRRTGLKTRAAVAWEASQPLLIEEIDLGGPKQGEALIRLVTAGVCHTDAYTLSGDDPEGLFPAVLGHEDGAVVEEIGAGVTSVKPGDHVIPLYTPNVVSANFVNPAKLIYAKRSELPRAKA